MSREGLVVWVRERGERVGEASSAVGNVLYGGIEVLLQVASAVLVKFEVGYRCCLVCSCSVIATTMSTWVTFGVYGPVGIWGVNGRLVLIRWIGSCRVLRNRVAHRVLI